MALAQGVYSNKEINYNPECDIELETVEKGVPGSTHAYTIINYVNMCVS